MWEKESHFPSEYSNPGTVLTVRHLCSLVSQGPTERNGIRGYTEITKMSI